MKDAESKLARFISQSKRLFPGKFEYEKCVYTGAESPICLVCKVHGEFWQTPYVHVRSKYGCPKCAYKIVGKKSSLTNGEFIRRCTEINDGKYDYSLTVYAGMEKRVEVICSVHGAFWIRASSHLDGHGCKKCTAILTHEKIAWSQEKFLEEAEKIHGDRYDYSKSVYQNANTQVCIICRKHGEFWQTPWAHIRCESDCRKCATENTHNRQRRTHEKFMEEIDAIEELKKYDFSKTRYQDSYHKVEVICPVHGPFWTMPPSLLEGSGCFLCAARERADRKISNTEEFIMKATEVHGRRYDYSLVDYKRSNKKVKIICHNHGVFHQVPNQHLHGSGCPKCRSSKGENRIRTWLIDNHIEFKEQKTFKDCKYKNNLRFDFAILEEGNVIHLLEYQGGQHYKPMVWNGVIDKELAEKRFKEQVIRDEIKREYCKSHNIPLLEIHHKDYKNIPKILENLLFDK